MVLNPTGFVSGGYATPRGGFCFTRWEARWRRENSPLLKIARVLVRLDHVANVIVNANHRLMRAAAVLRVSDGGRVVALNSDGV